MNVVTAQCVCCSDTVWMLFRHRVGVVLFECLCTRVLVNVVLAQCGCSSSTIGMLFHLSVDAHLA